MYEKIKMSDAGRLTIPDALSAIGAKEDICK